MAPSPAARPTVRPPTLIFRITLPVFRSMRHTVPSPAFATQTAPSPKAIALGASPTGIDDEELASGSTRDTVSSKLFATHTEPGPTAIARGPRPTLIDSTAMAVCGSIREIVLRSSPLAIQTSPGPTAIADGRPSGYPSAVMRPARGSIRPTYAIVWPANVTQTSPPPAAIAPSLDRPTLGSIVFTTR